MPPFELAIFPLFLMCAGLAAEALSRVWAPMDRLLKRAAARRAHSRYMKYRRLLQ
jgi:hypothetical protein